jgi:TolA-binding protein
MGRWKQSNACAASPMIPRRTVVPEVVSYEKNGVDAQGVDYARLTALLIEATKQQHREIKSQEARIRKLTRHVQEMQKVQRQMAALEARLARVEVKNGSNQASAATLEVPGRNLAGGRLEE